MPVQLEALYGAALLALPILLMLRGLLGLDGAGCLLALPPAADPLPASWWTDPSTQFCTLLMPDTALASKNKTLDLPCMAAGKCSGGWFWLVSSPLAACCCCARHMRQGVMFA